MIICDQLAQWKKPDHKNSNYSIEDFIFYGWVPVNKRDKMPNHLLILRKNLITKDWEVHREFMDEHSAYFTIAKNLNKLITNLPTGVWIVEFKSKSLQEALNFGMLEYKKYHDWDDLLEALGVPEDFKKDIYDENYKPRLRTEEDNPKHQACKHVYPIRSFECNVPHKIMDFIFNLIRFFFRR